MTQMMQPRTLPLRHDTIENFAKFRNPINHPAAIFRKEIILGSGGYPLIYPEDYLLWVKLICAGYKFGNLDSVLVRMRTGNEFFKRRGLRFLKGELQIYMYLKRAGRINMLEFFIVSILRSLVRLTPRVLRPWLYRHFRRLKIVRS